MNIETVSTSILYEMKRTHRARRLRITIHSDARVVVSAPFLMPKLLINRFIESKKKWIEDKVQKFRNNPPGPIPLMATGGRREFKENKKQALELVRARLEHFSSAYQFPFSKVTIRNQKTRWGSCSRNRALSFNYRIVFLTPEVQDYLIVHELCHLKEFNHSKNFWDLVAKEIPDYKVLRNRLKGVNK